MTGRSGKRSLQISAVRSAEAAYVVQIEMPVTSIHLSDRSQPREDRMVRLPEVVR
jgi:hypothetical protein